MGTSLSLSYLHAALHKANTIETGQGTFWVVVLVPQSNYVIDVKVY